MRVVVDYDLCERHARCMAAAPEIFDVRGVEQSRVLVDNQGEELRPTIEEAICSCPRGAIDVLDDDEAEQS